jgi:hypothetical protein
MSESERGNRKETRGKRNEGKMPINKKEGKEEKINKNIYVLGNSEWCRIFVSNFVYNYHFC